jgi:tetratricopeptide (TPR) repeat protein
VLGKELITLCDKLVIAHPNDAKAHAIYGDVLMNNDNVTAAIRQYEKTLSLNDRNFMVWEQLMYGLEIVENYDEMARVSTNAIDLFPNQAISYYFNGKALTAKNDFKKAMSSLDEASLISSGNVSIESRVQTVKGEIYLKQKNYTKAMESADQAITLSKQKNSMAYELKGDIYKEQNDLKKAAIAWQSSKDLGNNTVRLAEKIKSTIGN